MRHILWITLLAGCGAHGRVAAPDMASSGPQYDSILVSPNPKLDVLFLVDNSPSMAPMSDELKMRFPQFLKAFSDLASNGTYSDLHIGVVTSDFGAGATGAPGCDPSPGGQFGKLQPVGLAAASGCLPPIGADFVEYRFTDDNSNPNNLPKGEDLATTFTCMASVGSAGCSFEHQLESVHAALQKDYDPGFLRDDARLLVVFVTNEDDASAPPDSDVFDKNKVSEYGFEDSYSRQTRFAIVCGDPPMAPPYGDSMGPLDGCMAAPNPYGQGPGKQYDIGRYLDFFTKPRSQGGVKDDPNDVILVGVDAPSKPFQVILAHGGPAGQDYTQCSPLNEASNPPCVPVLQHSCQNPMAPVFFGDPAVRLNTVINAARHHRVASICDDDYTGALADFGQLVIAQIGGCLPWTFPDVAHPQCDVVDNYTLADGTTRETPLAYCPDGANTFPCWGLEKRDYCADASPQSLAIAINRNGAPPPAGVETRVNCLVLPPS